MENEEFMFTLNAPTSLEESIVDCLLIFEAEHGFETTSINAHDHRNEGLSLAEQVTGRERKIRFQMTLKKQNLAKLINRLKADFSGSGINYWVTPIVDKGFI
ncbi:MAG: DUF3240 family protein [Methylococcaceae bacterium]|nr:DUF3240 family protein [Methylococcaceae bacterium]